MSFNKAKALAFLLYMRHHENTARYETKEYTINKLHDITRTHSITIKKRLAALESMGLIGYGGRKDHYTFLKVRAHNKKRNTYIQIPNEATLKQIEKIVLAARLQLKIRQTDFINNALCISHTNRRTNGSLATTEEIKKARKYVSGHCNIDYRKDDFVNGGWSYKGIAHYLGTSIAKAVEIVKYAVKQHLVKKNRRMTTIRISSKEMLEYIDYTYMHNGYAVRMYANTYSLPTW